MRLHLLPCTFLLLLTLHAAGWHFRPRRTASFAISNEVPCDRMSREAPCNVSGTISIEGDAPSEIMGYDDEASKETPLPLWPREKDPIVPVFTQWKRRELFLNSEDVWQLPLRNIRTQCSPHHVGTYGHYYLNVAIPTLTPYLASGDTAIIVIAGGSGYHISWEVEATSPARYFQNMGISAFILKYRVPVGDWKNEHFVIDAQRAISIVRKKYNKTRVGVFGASFGGRVVQELAVYQQRLYEKVDSMDDTSSSFKPDFSIMLYPVVNLAVLRKVTNAPPTFIAGSSNDPCVDHNAARAYCKILNDQKNESCELHEYHNSMTGYGTCEYYPFLNNQPECNWPDKSKRFIDSVFRVED